MNDPIIIVSCVRSGADMVSQVLSGCGVFGGISGKVGPFFSNVFFKQTISPYLRWHKADPSGQNPLPPWNVNQPFPALRQRVNQLIVANGYTGGDWFVEDFRIALMWRVWADAYPNAKWIIVRRRPEDIVLSCLATGYMNAYSTGDQWAEWVRQFELRMLDLESSIVDAFSVWPSKFVHGEFHEIESVVRQLGLTWEPNSVIPFVKDHIDLETSNGR